MTEKRSHVRRVGERVPLALCKQRALDFLADQGPGYMAKPSEFAGHIWPGADFRAQGAAAAASRILKHLEREGRIRWGSAATDWGWKLA